MYASIIKIWNYSRPYDWVVHLKFEILPLKFLIFVHFITTSEIFIKLSGLKNNLYKINDFNF